MSACSAGSPISNAASCHLNIWLSSGFCRLNPGAMPTNLRRKTSTSAAEVREESSVRSEEHTSELQSHLNLVCRLLLEKKKKTLHEYPWLAIMCDRHNQKL